MASTDLLHRIYLTGALPAHEVANLISIATRCVQHSVVARDKDHKGKAVGAIDEQRSGLPVVSSRHAEIPNTVKKAEKCLLVEKFGRTAVAELDVRIANDPRLVGRIVAAARTRAADLCSCEHTIGPFADILLVAAFPGTRSLRGKHAAKTWCGPGSQAKRNGVIKSQYYDAYTTKTNL